MEGSQTSRPGCPCNAGAPAAEPAGRRTRASRWLPYTRVPFLGSPHVFRPPQNKEPRAKDNWPNPSQLGCRVGHDRRYHCSVSTLLPLRGQVVRQDCQGRTRSFEALRVRTQASRPSSKQAIRFTMPRGVFETLEGEDTNRSLPVHSPGRFKHQPQAPNLKNAQHLYSSERSSIRATSAHQLRRRPPPAPQTGLGCWGPGLLGALRVDIFLSTARTKYCRASSAPKRR